MKTHILESHHPGYPEALSLLELMMGGQRMRAPALYLRGTLPRKPGIAVVGTRQASAGALELTAELVAVAAEAGCSIWSGGARGIDSAAHEAALAVGAPTVVMMAGGLDLPPYPEENAELFERIVEAGGALASVHPDGTPRQRLRFVQRNQPLAALTFATLVVQRGQQSGAGYTTSAARKFGRDVLAVPDAPWSKAGGGFGVELAKGCEVIWDGKALRSYLDEMLPRVHGGVQLTLGLPRTSPAPALSTECAPSVRRPTIEVSALDEPSRRTLDCMSEVPQHADALCVATGLPYRELTHALYTLCSEGFVLEAPLGHFRLSPRARAPT